MYVIQRMRNYLNAGKVFPARLRFINDSPSPCEQNRRSCREVAVGIEQIRPLMAIGIIKPVMIPCKMRKTDCAETRENDG